MEWGGGKFHVPAAVSKRQNPRVPVGGEGWVDTRKILEILGKIKFSCSFFESISELSGS